MVIRAFRALALTTGILSVLTVLPAHAQSFGDLLRSTQGKATGAFGTMAIAVKPRSGIQAAPQWRSVLDRMQRDRVQLERCVADQRSCATSQQKQWAAMVRSARGQDRATRLRTVNAFFNQFAYRTDHELYGRSEYWASPAEFLANSGDCEDYAIAKYFTLRELGFRSDDMKVVVVTDKIRGMGHAVLTAQLDGRPMVLDNLRAEVVPETSARQYVALASMNEGGIWVDIPAPRQRTLDRIASLQ